MNDAWAWALDAAPGGGLAAVVFFAILAVIRGWLVPRSTLDLLNASAAREIAVIKERLEESKAREHEWKAAFNVSDEARRLQTEQLKELLAMAQATDAFMRALPARGGGEPQ